MSERRPGPGWRTRLATAIGASVLFVLAGTGVAYAYWVAKAGIGATATSTNAAVSLGGSSGLTTTYTATAKGPVITALTLANNGGTPLTLALTATNSNATLSGAISLTYWVRSGTTCGSTVPTSGITTGTLAAPPALPSGAASANAGASVVICAATSFTGTYASYAGQSTAVTLTLTGKVGTNWTATSTGTFTQALQSVLLATLACTEADGGYNVVLKWANPGSATSSTLYRVKATLQPPVPDTAFVVGTGTPSYWSTQQYVPSASFSVNGVYVLDLWMYANSTDTAGTYLASYTVTVGWNQWQSGRLVTCGG
ncbi:MAG: hypothetical protein LCH76_01000 [Actinobacteria bacterium]|nr:hypothetical protein [Actinomycetota bacterium]